MIYDTPPLSSRRSSKKSKNLKDESLNVKKISSNSTLNKAISKTESRSSIISYKKTEITNTQ